MKARTAFVVAAALVAGYWSACGGPRGESLDGRIVVARRVLTIEEQPSVATAVAIEGGRIAAVGSLDEVRAAVGERAFTVDRRFADKVLVAGFVDPHVHPTLAATILPLEIVSAVEWETPRGRTRPVRDRDAFLARLRELDAATAPGEWLLTWGYHRPYHGELGRADLDAVSTTRPVFVWQRSVHEMYFNTRALEELGLTRADFDAHPQADWEAGRLWERAVFTLGRPMIAVLAAPLRYLRGLDAMSDVIRRGGLTTVAEQGFPQTGVFTELALLHWEMRSANAAYRFALVPNAMFLLREEGTPDAALRAAEGLLAWSTDRVRILRHAKYYADGAVYSLLMQMSDGYDDGHHGEWLMPPDRQRAVLGAFWDAGWDLHIHVNGDLGLDTVLDHVAERRDADPSGDTRVVLEHYGYAREDQHARVAALGVEVSNNAYYPFELAPVYARDGLGPERAADISPLGGLVRAGVPFSFHSDFPMAPAKPLALVEVAVTRVASDGRVWGEDQRIALDRALAAVTIEGARSLGLDDEIGSIRTGKRADFTVLDKDPYEVAADRLSEIEIWGTVVDGRAHPLD